MTDDHCPGCRCKKFVIYENQDDGRHKKEPETFLDKNGINTTLPIKRRKARVTIVTKRNPQ